MAEELTLLEHELLLALKLLLRAWVDGVDPNSDAAETAKRAIEKAERRKHG